MPEKANGCSTCALLKDLKDRGTYYANARKNRSSESITVCKAVVVMEDYYKNSENEMEYGGRVSYNPRPLNFCAECGRKVDQSELTW